MIQLNIYVFNGFTNQFRYDYKNEYIFDIFLITTKYFTGITTKRKYFKNS